MAQRRFAFLTENRLWMQKTDILLGIGVVAVVTMLIIPLPTFLLDLLLAVSIMSGVLILLVVMFIQRTFDFSIFPSLLLITTVFRLALNVSSTRLILLQGAAFDGKIIRAFGQFVVGGNYVVGFIIFIILVAVHRHEDDEDDESDNVVPPDDELAEGSDDLAVEGRPLEQDKPRGGYVEREPEYRRDEEERRKDGKIERPLYEHHHQKNQHARHDAYRQQEIQQEGRQRDDEHGHHRHHADAEQNVGLLHPETVFRQKRESSLRHPASPLLDCLAKPREAFRIFPNYLAVHERNRVKEILGDDVSHVEPAAHLLRERTVLDNRYAMLNRHLADLERDAVLPFGDDGGGGHGGAVILERHREMGRIGDHHVGLGHLAAHHGAEEVLPLHLA